MRVVIEEPCEHGEYEEHVKPGGHPESSIAWCEGGSRRVLQPGEFLLIERVDGEWHLPGEAWTVLNAAAAFGVPTGSVGLLNDLLDALASLSAQEDDE